MQEHDQHIDHLIALYLSGESSEDQTRELEAWVLADPNHKTAFRQAKKHWMMAGLAKPGPQLDVESHWQVVREKVQPKTKTVKLRAARRSRWAIAATIGLLIVSGLWWMTQRADQSLVSTDLPVSRELADGSIIHLNRSTEIEYNYREDLRELSILGDGFFDVAHDQSRPFVVNTSGGQIEVLGTSFYLDARPDLDEVEVILEEGSVRMSFAGQFVVLSPGETGVYRKAIKELTKKPTENQNYRSWQHGKLFFDQTPLTTVIRDINRTFGREVVLENEAMATCLLTATYEDKSLDEILRLVEASFSMVSVEGQGKHLLRGGTCEN